jgi:hypothetical protein
MRVHTVLCALFFSLGCISLSAAQEEINRTFIVNALKLTLSVDELALTANAPVIIKATYTNTSKVELDLPTEPLVWKVRREDGKPVTETEQGKRRKGPRSAQTIVVSRVIAPGDTLAGEETISNLYHMEEPGVYFLNALAVIYDSEGQDYIKSNTIRIMIK